MSCKAAGLVAIENNKPDEPTLSPDELSKLKVDRLEFMLKSRGLHISQHRREY